MMTPVAGNSVRITWHQTRDRRHGPHRLSRHGRAWYRNGSRSSHGGALGRSLHAGFSRTHHQGGTP